VEAAVLAEIGHLNASLAPGALGPVGAVIGASLASRHWTWWRQRPVSGPGSRRAGIDAQDVARTFAACPERVMPSASRSLLAGGPDAHRLRDAVTSLGGKFRELLARSGGLWRRLAKGCAWLASER